jgi:hypothetical protein
MLGSEGNEFTFAELRRSGAREAVPTPAGRDSAARRPTLARLTPARRRFAAAHGSGPNRAFDLVGDRPPEILTAAFREPAPLLEFGGSAARLVVPTPQSSTTSTRHGETQRSPRMRVVLPAFCDTYRVGWSAI